MKYIGVYNPFTNHLLLEMNPLQLYIHIYIYIYIQYIPLPETNMCAPANQGLEY